MIRNVDPMVVKTIDEKAKKMKQSRQVFLKNMIENYVMMQELNERETELKTTLEKNTEMLMMVGDHLRRHEELFDALLDE